MNNIDDSNNILQTLKLFLYGIDDELIVRNEFGERHNTKFISWVGDGHSLILTDEKNEYRLTITKEEV